MTISLSFRRSSIPFHSERLRNHFNWSYFLLDQVSTLYFSYCKKSTKRSLRLNKMAKNFNDSMAEIEY
jgi:hypothetical protein